MPKLSYKTLADANYGGYLLPRGAGEERVLQFGEGNFLRAFAEHFIDEMNEKCGWGARAALVQPRGGHPGAAAAMNAQDGLYTLILRGLEGGRPVSKTRVVSCVSTCLDPLGDWAALMKRAENPALRFIVSNTTEAGLRFDPACQMDDAPPAAFPAKLCAFLRRRHELGLPGFWLLPCELNDHNGDLLRQCLRQYAELWRLGRGFTDWLENENRICSTLVDRIVTGYPKKEAEGLARELGYEDAFLDTAEVFGCWVIEAPGDLAREMPFQEAGLPITLTDDHGPYKKRKVRILNGAHTSMVLAAFLAGEDIVRGCLQNPLFKGFLDRLLRREVIPTLEGDMDRTGLEDFARDVLDRFANPYIDHALLSIALNSTAKWKARVLPTVVDYVSLTGELPPCLTFSFAAYLAFYSGRGGREHEVQDDPWVLAFYRAHRGDSAEALARAAVDNQEMWGDGLAKLPGFAEAVAGYLAAIETKGMAAAVKGLLS